MPVKESSLPRDWFGKGKTDIKTVELLLTHGGDTEVAAMHIQQAVEKFLKGYLLFHKWKLKRTHDLVELLDYAVEHNPKLEKFRRFCEKATAFYFESRYPFFQQEPAKKEIEYALDETRELVDIVLKEVEV